MEHVKDPGMNPEDRIKQMISDWQQPLLRTCCILLGDIDQAHDAVQETFVKAWKGLPNFRGDCSEKTWLMRIAINVCHDMRRNTWYRIVDRKISIDDIPEPSSAPWEDDYAIFSLISSLPRKQREVVLLRFYHNMSYSEIAETLNISQPAVTKRMNIAKKTLKTLLKEGIE